MREGINIKFRRQTTWSKRGDHVGQADNHNGTGVQGDEPRRTGARTFQNGLVGKRRKILGIKSHQTHGNGAGQGALFENIVTLREIRLEVWAMGPNRKGVVAKGG